MGKTLIVHLSTVKITVPLPVISVCPLAVYMGRGVIASNSMKSLVL